MIAPRRGNSIGRKPVPAGLAALAKASITCALLAPPSLFDRQAGISERGVPGRHTEHNLETGCGAVGHQVRLAGGGAERGFDIEQAGFWGCRQHLCENGGDGADIAGGFGKQHGVTVLEGKWHDPCRPRLPPLEGDRGRPDSTINGPRGSAVSGAAGNNSWPDGPCPMCPHGFEVRRAWNRACSVDLISHGRT